MVLGQLRACTPFYIEKSGRSDVTDPLQTGSQTLKDIATQAKENWQWSYKGRTKKIGIFRTLS